MTNFALIILMAAALAIILAFIILVLLPAAKGESEGKVVFKGWIAREEEDKEVLWCFSRKPIRDAEAKRWDIAPDDNEWVFRLPIQKCYPMKWEDEPMEIEILIRPKSEPETVFDEDLEAAAL